MDSRSAGEKSPSGPISIQIDLISLKSSEVKFFGIHVSKQNFR